ncbi:uncharacterized protein EDB93DRAFT_1105483 [Suillus bovinus]|uniref:uncharacterized protein n=1 Tax=Suillus bovinus TaxID=48563 RepID=UPI001B8727B2|nr:uncharacterized protein EDB93DRAFT_1105483 [Suillus bovinus]KAG2142228.1 hypothetical protein EDB93DRAFT_1105483 [Suillus bovinus]
MSSTIPILSTFILITLNMSSSSWTSVVNVLGDVIFLDIQNAVTLDGTYCFNLHIDTFGTKKIVFCIREQIEEAVQSDESVNDLNLPQSVIASPCNLLTRHMSNSDPDLANPTAPWSYYVTRTATEVPEA